MKAPFKKNHLSKILSIALLTLATGCTVVGPDYQRPTVDIPDTYKETTELSNADQDTLVTTQTWWSVFNDQELDNLLSQVEQNNYSFQSIAAKFSKTQALANIARSAKSPSLVAGGRNDLGILINWEIDLWGKIKRNIEANEALVAASKAELDAAKLALQAQLAQHYFLLRVQDAELELLNNTVSSYQDSLQITRNQYAVGVANNDNIAQAQGQLSTAKVQLLNAQINRAHLEHKIAVIVGKAPSQFSIAVKPLQINLPTIPNSLPADLLRRRPDIVAAERRMAEASAKIGVAAAQAYPELNLFAGATIRNGLIGGGDVEVPLYTAGAIDAQNDAAAAEYEAVIASYRQTVLESLKEVEDNLIELKLLEQVSKAQSDALTALHEVVHVTNNQYDAGVTNYQSIILAQSSALSNEREALKILGRQLVTSVTLIKALGGGWQAPQTSTQENEQ